MALMTQAVYQKLVRDIDVIYEDARKALVHWDLYILNDGTFFSPSPLMGEGRDGGDEKRSPPTFISLDFARDPEPVEGLPHKGGGQLGEAPVGRLFEQSRAIRTGQRSRVKQSHLLSYPHALSGYP